MPPFDSLKQVVIQLAAITPDELHVQLSQTVTKYEGEIKNISQDKSLEPSAKVAKYKGLKDRINETKTRYTAYLQSLKFEENKPTVRNFLGELDKLTKSLDAQISVLEQNLQAAQALVRQASSAKTAEALQPSPALAPPEVSAPEVVKPQYDYVEDGGSSSDIIRVRKDGKWGLIDERGKEIVKPQYDDIGWIFSKNRIKVERDGKWGFIDKKGREIVKPQYDDVADFMFEVEDMTSVKRGSKWGFINKEGKEVVKPKYDHVESFITRDGTVCVKNNGKWGLINKEGEEIVPLEYDSIEELKDSRSFLDKIFGD